jgi:hypothetical protein
LVFVCRFIAGYPHARDVLFSISFVPERLVLDEAALAPRVTDAELYVAEAELIDGLL